MLHLIYQSHTNNAVFQRIEDGDDVVFYDNAVFQTLVGHCLEAKIQNLLSNNIRLYVLNEELETRGIDYESVVSGIEVIDYAGLVELTVKNAVIQTWK